MAKNIGVATCHTNARLIGIPSSRRGVKRAGYAAGKLRKKSPNIYEINMIYLFPICCVASDVV